MAGARDDAASTGVVAPAPVHDARRVAVASAIRTTIEWYDFFIYGTAAATVFGPRFFPRSHRSPPPWHHLRHSA